MIMQHQAPPAPPTAMTETGDKGIACAACHQVPSGQTGEYPCGRCGLPTLHDERVLEMYGRYDADPRVNGPDDYDAFRDAVVSVLVPTALSLTGEEPDRRGG